MFNYISKCDDNMILFNSYTGIQGVVAITKSSLEQVDRVLHSNEVMVDCELVQRLIDGGFLVDINVNEINKRNVMYARFVTNPSLLMVVHVTKNCNFRCPYCNLTFSDENLEPSTEEGIVKFIQRNFNKYNDVQIDWFGGEPLLDIDLIERLSKKLIYLCDRAKKMYRGTITTNGYLLTLDNVKRLINNRVHVFSITIDGLVDTHNKQRVLANGAGTHERLVKNMIDMKNNIPNSDMRVVIRTNITKPILERIEEYYHYYDRLFGDDRRFSILVRPAMDIGGDRVEQIKDDFLTNPEYNGAIRRLAQIAKPTGLQFASNFYDLNRCGSTCTAICANKFTISTDGRASKCDAVQLDNDIGVLNSSGSIDPGKTHEDDWLSGCFNDQIECEHCFFSACCLKGQCPMTRIRGDDFLCRIDTEAIDALLQLYTATHFVPVI
jgi:uncharacterized protein